jgi:hypothetical protein
MRTKMLQYPAHLNDIREMVAGLDWEVHIKRIDGEMGEKKWRWKDRDEDGTKIDTRELKRGYFFHKFFQCGCFY